MSIRPTPKGVGLICFLRLTAYGCRRLFFYGEFDHSNRLEFVRKSDEHSGDVHTLYLVCYKPVVGHACIQEKVFDQFT